MDLTKMVSKRNTISMLHSGNATESNHPTTSKYRVHDQIWIMNRFGVLVHENLFCLKIEFPIDRAEIFETVLTLVAVQWRYLGSLQPPPPVWQFSVSSL